MNIRDIAGTKLLSDEVEVRVDLRSGPEPIVVVPEHAVSVRLKEHVDSVEARMCAAPFLAPHHCFAMTEAAEPVDAPYVRIVDRGDDAIDVVLVFEVAFSPRMGRHASRRLRLVERSLQWRP